MKKAKIISAVLFAALVLAGCNEEDRSSGSQQGDSVYSENTENSTSDVQSSEAQSSTAPQDQTSSETQSVSSAPDNSSVQSDTSTPGTPQQSGSDPEANSALTIRGNKVVDCDENAETVVIPQGIDEIDEYAFADCKKLQSVTIAGTVRDIEDFAFRGCTSLVSITIPAGTDDMSDSAFDGCTALKEINVENGNREYSSIDGVLYGKGKTELIRLPEGKSGDFSIPGGVYEIDDKAFANTGIKSIVIPDAVREIGESAFEGCNSLTSVTLGNGITEIEERTFKNCSSLTSVTLPDSVREIEYSAFEGCEKVSVSYKGKTYSYAQINELYRAANGR